MKIRKNTRYVPVSTIENGKLTNWDILPSGAITKIGYSSLRGFIKILKEQNKKLKKMECEVTFTIKLPIKG